MGSPCAIAAVWIGLAFLSATIVAREGTGIAVSLVEILVRVK
jgi:hypothetical protein